MEIIFEMLLELILEIIVEASSDKKVPKIVRYLLKAVIILFVAFVILGLFFLRDVLPPLKKWGLLAQEYQRIQYQRANPVRPTVFTNDAPFVPWIFYA